MTETSAEDHWAFGTPITVEHPLHAIVAAWAEVERSLNEWGVPQAEPRAKALMARLAGLAPPVLVVHPSEIAEGDDADERIQQADAAVVEVLDLVTGWCGPHAEGDLGLIEAAANRALDVLRRMEPDGG